MKSQLKKNQSALLKLEKKLSLNQTRLVCHLFSKIHNLNALETEIIEDYTEEIKLNDTIPDYNSSDIRR